MLKFKKTISILIIFGLLISYFSYSSAPVAYATDGGGGYAAAAAGWAHFAKYVLKEFILDLAARLVARLQLTGALNGIAQQVIQSGRTGRAPAFIQNWRNFITDAEYRGEDVFRSILANTQNCPNIKKDLLSLFGASGNTQITQNIRVGNLDSYQVRGKCTLPAGWSIQNYNRDFAGNGGWQALTRLASPENNFYGATLIAMGELNAQRDLDRNADRGEGTSGAGFTGIRKSSRTGNSCDTPPTTGAQCVNNACSDGSGPCTSSAQCGGSSVPSQARCRFLGNITTPSKVLGEGAAKFIDSNLNWLTTSDEISEILGNFIQTMISKLAEYTANAIAPGNVAEPQKAQYDACVRQCNNTSVGSQMTTCIDRCYKQAGVDLPPNYDSSNFQNESSPTPTPTVTPTPSSTITPTPTPPFVLGNNVLLPGQSMLPGQAMHSLNGRYSFDLDMVGNLILYDYGVSPYVVLWSSSTSGNPTELHMATDGNLILYFNGGALVAWASNTAGNPDAFLDLSNTGDVVIYSSTGTPIKTIYQNP
ncbi:MAG: hypothetical protein HYT62_02715 [Candidatus Yanofskybacteria bacterium]|nr:hypothetical protein [Candidatus Yanofskybacteria bacterium]